MQPKNVLVLHIKAGVMVVKSLKLFQDKFGLIPLIDFLLK